MYSAQNSIRYFIHLVKSLEFIDFGFNLYELAYLKTLTFEEKSVTEKIKMYKIIYLFFICQDTIRLTFTTQQEKVL